MPENSSVTPSDMFEVPGATPHFRTELAAQLAELVPEAVTDGKLDIEKLRELLADDVADGNERFGLFWPGKKRALRAAQAPTTATLKPDLAHSKDWDTTQNVFIEGDNLEVLKTLQRHYHNKIKLIYIDPPYNTGKDFVYPDNFKEGLDTYLEWTRQVNEEGKKVSTNSETEGRYHSNWLNMMYPRLKLARNLLTDDGVVFISIDDKEMDNLRKLCSEVFGEGNAIGIICWKNVTDNNPTLLNKDNEFVLCYAKNINAQPDAWKSGVSEAKDLLQAEFVRLKNEGLPHEFIETKIREFISDNTESLGFLTRYKNVDEHGIYTGSESVHNPRAGGYVFQVNHPKTGLPMRTPANGYRFPEATFREMEGNGVILYGDDEKRIVKIKKYLSDYEDTLRSVIVMDGRLGSYDIKRLFGRDNSIFTNPKPVELLKSFLSYATDKESIVLDFFAGSGTTGQAVMELNRADGGKRRFIMVQLPEPTPEDSEARKAGFNTIADISRKRIELAGGKIKADSPMTTQELDTGFRAYRLADTNFSKWRVTSEVAVNELEQHLLDLRDSADDEAQADDLLTELLLKLGYSLTEPIHAETIAGLEVRKVGDNGVLAYLNEHAKPTLAQLRALVDAAPSKIIVLEDAFQGDDELKTNLAQHAKSRGIELWTA